MGSSDTLNAKLNYNYRIINMVQIIAVAGSLDPLQIIMNAQHRLIIRTAGRTVRTVARGGGGYSGGSKGYHHPSQNRENKSTKHKI